MKKLRARKIGKPRQRHSKVLNALVGDDSRIESYHFRIWEEFPHQLILKWPWVSMHGFSWIEEKTVREVIHQLVYVEKGCDGCGHAFYECECLPDSEK